MPFTTELADLLADVDWLVRAGNVAAARRGLAAWLAPPA
jgi:hypothetical protein